MTRKINSRKTFLAVVFLALVAVLGNMPREPAAAQDPGSLPDFDYITPIISAIDIAETQQHVEVLSSFGTRYTSYSGSEAAASYIYDRFSEHLTGVEYLPFNVTLPVDEGAYLELSTETVELYPLLPNLVCPPQTPPGGIVGELVYVGDGDTSDFDGKEIEGSIAMMDFNSDYGWIDAADLGSKSRHLLGAYGYISVRG